MPASSQEVHTRVSWLPALCVALLLILTINSQSIWTDEAFSAFIASHRTFADCWNTLAAGDSSDLQMAAYYLYLHGWCNLFGQSEIALRAANIPFFFLYSGVLVWVSRRLFRSRWVWAVALLTPLTFTFCNDTRPYFDIIALSLTVLTCLLVYLDNAVTTQERVWLPWLALLSFVVGAGFHMLMLLSAPPLLALLTVFYIRDRQRLNWRDWRRPTMVFFPIAIAMAVYFSWTFSRGATYDYAPPDLLSFFSVMFRFLGLSGYLPNRRYDIPFRPFLLGMALSAGAVLGGIVALFIARWRSENRIPFQALAAALTVAMAEVFVLSFAVHQQIEFRHLSSLLPLLILLVMSGLSAGGRTARPYVAFAAVAIGLTWLVSDLRSLSPQYAREDFRSAVKQAIHLHNSIGAEIAIAADPAAAAYYGLQLTGPAPCFPLRDSCRQGFSKVPWGVSASAEYALFWKDGKIREWLADQQRHRIPAVLLISRSRHPMVKDSAWWPAMKNSPRTLLYPFQGFYVYLIRP